MAVRFCPITSGSSGNCIFVGSDNANILIDAGISGVRIIEGLSRIGVSPLDIDAVFVTHDHSDHIKGAGVFSRKFKKPIYATEGTWRIMRGTIAKIDEQNVKYIEDGTVIRCKDMEIVPFRVPHDAADPVGYSIISGGVKATVATDIGRPNDEIKEMLRDSDIILLEANHDVNMLKNGPYPYYLKKRILSDVGHLSNETAAELLCSVISDKLRHVYLGHLSAENNTPRLAFETAYEALKQSGKLMGTYTLRCANRAEVSVLAEV